MWCRVLSRNYWSLLRHFTVARCAQSCSLSFDCLWLFPFWTNVLSFQSSYTFGDRLFNWQWFLKIYSEMPLYNGDRICFAYFSYRTASLIVFTDILPHSLPNAHGQKEKRCCRAPYWLTIKCTMFASRHWKIILPEIIFFLKKNIIKTNIFKCYLCKLCPPSFSTTAAERDGRF